VGVQFLQGRCRSCEYHETVAVGDVDEATVPVVWGPARCPGAECGLISVNVLNDEHECPECGNTVALYVEDGVPEPSEGWPCPECREPALSFAVVFPES
jgi:hypothetical protein